MHLEFSPEENEFRLLVREWLTTNVPREPRPKDIEAARDFDVAWQRRQFEGGWAGINWPKERGGAGLTVIQHLIWPQESGRAGAPPLGTLSVALPHAGPTLIALGTDAQKQFHLPRILRGDSVWCQGFSEPGAGSDLAGIKTRGVVDGDSIVVTGQKIWTSHAQVADYQELLIRTDPGGSRHSGMSWVICDMKTPGITVRPIETIAGTHHFCEVFYDGVRIPIENVVGGLNNGWHVAMSTLGFERAGSVAGHMTLAKDLDRLIQIAGECLDETTGETLLADQTILAEFARLKASLAGLTALTYTVVSQENSQSGAESAMLALYYAELLQRVQRLAMRLLSVDALGGAKEAQEWIYRYLHSYSYTIMGGTSEIRRNIIAQRGLGLPR